jgi:serine/threonine protein kinase
MFFRADDLVSDSPPRKSLERAGIETSPERAIYMHVVPNSQKLNNTLSKKRPHESVDYIAHRQSKNPQHINSKVDVMSIVDHKMSNLLQPQAQNVSVSPSLDPMIVPTRNTLPPSKTASSTLLISGIVNDNLNEILDKPEFLPHTGATFTVLLTGRNTIGDTKTGKYTTYQIQTTQTAPFVRRWSVQRRYRHFVDFRTKLRRCGAKNISALPPKTWTSNNFDETFLQKRQEGLNSWLRSIPPIYSLSTIDSKLDIKNKDNITNVIRSFLIDLENDNYVLGRRVVGNNEYMDGSKGNDTNNDDNRNNNKTGSMSSNSSSTIATPTGTPSRLHLSINNNGLTTTPPIAAVTLSSFELLKVLGKGSYGKVILVRKKTGHDAGSLYAMKVLKKEHVMKKKQVAHTRTERSVLGSIRHPFIVRLHYAFQTGEKLHFVLDYCSGGELFFHLQKHGRFPPKLALFYTAELALALGELHQHGVVYRDMKPENILLDDLGHVQLADFGLSKEGIKSGEKGTRSFCGTPEYLAPEVLERKGHGFAVDWWALGALLYEMITGLPPWYSRDRQKMFACIRGAPLQFPGYVVGELKALIADFLVREPTNRLGGRGEDVLEIKEHSIFRNVNWDALVRRETKPPWKPPVQNLSASFKNSYDVSNFEQTFTNLPVQSLGSSLNDSLGRAVRGESATNGAFEGFTYVDESMLMEENFRDRLNVGLGVDKK